MSKLTAEEFIKESGLNTLHFQQSSYDFENHPLYKLMEQYANAKLLEVLKKEVKKAFEAGIKAEKLYYPDQHEDEFNKYFETQVKPRYE